MEKEMRKLGADFSAKELLPSWEEMDGANDALLEKILKAAAGSGIFGFAVPESAGGSGLGAAEYSVFIDEVARTSGSVAALFAAHFAGVAPLLLSPGGASALSRITDAEGKGTPHLFAAAINENSRCEFDVSNIHVTLAKKDGGFVLSGFKRKVVGGGAAENFTVLAKMETTGEYAWVVVSRSANGVKVAPESSRMGLKLCPVNDVVFENVEISEADVIKKFTSNDELLRYHSFIDPVLSAVSIGIASGARDAAMKYSLERYQGGKMICEHDALRMMFADMEINLRAAKSLAGGGECGYVSSAFAATIAEKCCLDSVQCFGGYGYMKEYRVERALRDAKTFKGIVSAHDRAQKLIINDIEKLR